MALIFAGFNGLPVQGGTGLKAPLVFDESSKAYALLRDNQLGPWRSELEISSFEEQALLTRIPLRTPYDPSLFVFYAHVQFIAPASGAALRLVVPQEMGLQPKAESFIALVKYPRAMAILKQWASSLLRSARTYLENETLPTAERGRAAFSEAMRARSASPMSSEEKKDRLEAFSLIWVGLHLQGSPMEPLLQDADLEGLRGEVSRRGTELLREIPHSGSTRQSTHRDLNLAPNRNLLEDAA